MARITYRKTRRGETIDIRADKGEDLRNVVKAIAKPVSDAQPLTADTITDEQIRGLRDARPCERFTITTHISLMATTQQSYSLWQLCMDAMRAPDYQRGDARVRLWPHGEARARCAAILNARRSA